MALDGSAARCLHVIVLVGMPGSGKSTFSRRVASSPSALARWRVVNQDDLKSRRACEHAVAEAIGQREHVIVDRCNFDASQRAHWLHLARWSSVPTAVWAVVFHVPAEECIRRVHRRTAHPTLPAADGERVVRSVNSQFTAPSFAEGFTRIVSLWSSPPRENPSGDWATVEGLTAALESVPPVPPCPILRGPACPVTFMTFNSLASCWVNRAWYPSTPYGDLEDANARAGRAAAAIRRAAPDVLCLQEMEHASLDLFRASLGDRYVFSELMANEPTAAPWENGVAIGVRRDSAVDAGWAVRRHVWTAEGSASAVLTGQVHGRPLAVVCSHLAFGEAGEEQADHALAWMRDRMAAEPGGLVAWCGDLNLPPMGPWVLRATAVGLVDSLAWRRKPTYFPDPATTKPKRVDYVIFSGHTLRLDGAGIFDANLGGPPAGQSDSDSSEGTEAGGGSRRGSRMTLASVLAAVGSDHLPVVARCVPRLPPAPGPSLGGPPSAADERGPGGKTSPATE